MVWADQISRKVTSKTYSFYAILLEITSNATKLEVKLYNSIQEKEFCSDLKSKF